MMIKILSLRYLASWQINTIHSILSRSRRMRTTTQGVHYSLLMHRQGGSISAAAIKSKITSRWEALTETRALLHSTRIYVGILSFSCLNKRVQQRVVPAVRSLKVVLRTSLDRALIINCIVRWKRYSPIIKISRTKLQLSRIEKALLPRIILS